MTRLRRLLPAAAAAAIALAAAPAASASTWTVDDDRLDCPNASFTTVQAAVEQAAPWDTVVICPGLYLERSTPTSGNNSPSQPGSQNGVTITKPLTIRGAGPGKVTIRPHPDAGPTLAGTAPFLRDGGGNVVTVARQAGGSSDDNENFVDISGVTIDSPATYAEAGVAFFNTSGRISNSVIGPLLRAADATELAARPHGWGAVMANSLQGTEAGVRRELTITGSVVSGYQSGGVLFDDARGADGAPTTLTRSGIVAYGNVVGSRIEGAGASDLIPQTGIRYHAGARGKVTDSDVLSHSFTPDLRQSVGLLLTDAHTTADPSNPTVRGFWAFNNRFTGNGYALFNADAANAAAREAAPALATPGTGIPGSENWWGCNTGPLPGLPSTASCQGISGADSTGAPTVERGANRTAMQILPPAPWATADAPPTGALAEPVGEAVAGADAGPVVVAADDFGVKSVSLSVDGTPLATDGRAPYEFSWTPTFAQLGDVVTFTATITDSSDATTTVTEEVEVVSPDGYEPISAGVAELEAGAVLVGATATRTVPIVNTGANPLTLTGVGVTGRGFAVGGTCAVALTLAPDESCTLVVTFAPAAAGPAAGAATIEFATPGGFGPLVIALEGTGTVAAASPQPPANASPPTLSGAPSVGATLTCVTGAWSGAPATLDVVWLRDGVAVAGGGSYRIRRTDTGATLTCRVTAANGAGSSAATADRAVVGFPAATTAKWRIRQAGSAIVTIRREADATRAGRLTVGSVACARAGIERCIVRIEGSLRIGGRAFAPVLRLLVPSGKSETAAFELGNAAVAALTRARRGTLTLEISVRDGTGISGATSVRLKVSR